MHMWEILCRMLATHRASSSIHYHHTGVLLYGPGRLAAHEDLVPDLTQEGSRPCQASRERVLHISMRATWATYSLATCITSVWGQDLGAVGYYHPLAGVGRTVCVAAC